MAGVAEAVLRPAAEAALRVAAEAAEAAAEAAAAGMMTFLLTRWATYLPMMPYRLML